LSSNAPFTQRQNEFMDALRNNTTEFSLKNKKFEDRDIDPIDRNSIFEVKGFVKAEGNGTVGGASTFSKYMTKHKMDRINIL